MKVLIVEDERPAAEKLQHALDKSNNDIEVLSVLASVKETVLWLNDHPAPQLIFMDIQVSDGLSFKIFEHSTVSCPVIFVTAYDEYWQNSFEYNGIDYLLKPVRQEKLDAALNKYKKLKEYFSVDYKRLLHHREPDNRGEYKKRLLVKKDLIITVSRQKRSLTFLQHTKLCFWWIVIARNLFLINPLQK